MQMTDDNGGDVDEADLVLNPQLLIRDHCIWNNMKVWVSTGALAVKHNRPTQYSQKATKRELKAYHHYIFVERYEK